MVVPGRLAQPIRHDNKSAGIGMLVCFATLALTQGQLPVPALPACGSGGSVSTSKTKAPYFAAAMLSLYCTGVGPVACTTT